MVKEFATLSEMGIMLGMPKSRLAYYRDCGLISPEAKLSSGGIYNLKETIKTIKEIEKMQSEGQTIAQIKKAFSKE